MTPEETLNKLLRDSINLLIANPSYTIRAKQKGAPRPVGAYSAVEFMSDTGIGWEQNDYEDQADPDTDLVQSISGAREIMFSIDFFRTSAIDNARKARTGFARESIKGLFRSGGIGLGRRSDVRDISESLEDGWEERAQFDIVLNAVGTDTDIVNAILSVDIAGAFEARGLIYNFNIEV